MDLAGVGQGNARLSGARCRPARRRGLAVLVIAGLALSLAGCNPAQEPATTTESATPEAPAADAGNPAAPAPDSSADGSEAPGGDVAILPPVDDDPQHLVGLDHIGVNEKLGKPTLIRHDGDAEIWQYRGENCVLDLFLYGEDKHVVHVDLRDRGDGNDSSVRQCYVNMLRAALPST